MLNAEEKANRSFLKYRQLIQSFFFLCKPLNFLSLKLLQPTLLDNTVKVNFDS